MASKDSKAADAAAEGDGDEPKKGAKGKLPIKLIAMGAGGLIAVVALGFGAMKFFSHGESEPQVAAAPKPAVFLDVPEVLVNLATGGSDRSQYLKVKVVLELPDEAMSPKVQTVMPRVMDTFQTYLREMRPSDLEGSAGLYRLKEELTRRVNAAVAPSKIDAVLFKEIVVQ